MATNFMIALEELLGKTGANVGLSQGNRGENRSTSR